MTAAPSKIPRLDLSVALGLGIAGGYYYWYGIHLKSLKKKEDFYLKLEKQKLEAS